MRINKNILIKRCQDFINSYHNSHGETDFSFYEKYLKFKFGIDEGYYGIKGNEIHIVIQGTDEKLEWKGHKSSNFNFLNKRVIRLSKNHAGRNRKIKVHPGFYEAFLTGKDYFLSLAQGKKYIFVTGHSRGAGIGTLAARDIQYHIDNIWKTNQKVVLITGGSPRVYNRAGAKEFDNCGIISYRLKYRNDPVSGVPLLLMGYRHIKGLIKLGKPFIFAPFPMPWDHEPIKYLEGMKKYKGIIV